MDLVSFAVWVSLPHSIWFFLQTGVLKLNFLVRFSYSCFTHASLLDCLCMLLFVCDRTPRVRNVLLRVSRFCRSSARQVTLWSHPFITQYLCISFTLKYCMSRIDNMWVLGNSWWGRTYCPIIIKPLGVTSTYCLYCHAMLVDVVWVSDSMTDVRL